MSRHVAPFLPTTVKADCQIQDNYGIQPFSPAWCRIWTMIVFSPLAAASCPFAVYIRFTRYSPERGPTPSSLLLSMEAQI
ncbi:hypothetical protein RRG08_029357 [Elysia crispata]|uniref:Uncharacterized protein n=1 Tax=Elysia crispata TaxID=231223 RepID=A0AAE1B7M7_9GAST|nr:hypothetical protein RRG08_029357 [Elysia crispata]